MKTISVCVWLIAVLVSLAGAQDRPKFEVASIKECKPGEPHPAAVSSPSRVSLACRPLTMLIQQAYDTFASGMPDPNRLNSGPMALRGAPGWLNSVLYSIDAKAESPQSGAMLRGPMMQALLEDRFQLKIHRESTEEDAYMMTVAKGGLKAPRAREGSCIQLDYAESFSMNPADIDVSKLCGVARRVQGPRDGIDIKGISFANFAKILQPDGRMVVDRTGEEGLFDIHIEWDPPNTPAPEPGAAADPASHINQMEATQKQLGVQLTPGKGLREYLVIDHIEKPAGN